ncbi:transposase domain-containing protein [Halodurantibacterium flavum]|uniref:Transposase domain-containing protein n=1 Tax=Halodurantibacterium flavum TaxID=1382802 RepID=A0ABW4S9J2_9RHOB
MVAPAREWWTTDALAASGLPDVPGTRQGVDALAARLQWRAHPEQARRRAGRGGGWEYHWKLLPLRAQTALLKAAAAPAAPEVKAEARPSRDEIWAWFDGLPEKVKETASARLRIVQLVDQLTGPMGRHLAVEAVARQEGKGTRTLWLWLSMIDGVDPADRLAYLAPRHRAAKPRRERAECSQEFLDWLKADYLRLGGPSFSSCYDRVVALCESRGVGFLAPRTARRWIEDNIPRVTRIFAREGEKGLARCFPPQIRDRSTMSAMEGVNADCHKIDVFVQWPGISKPVRPQIVAFQDLYSRKILSWRVDLDPNKVAVMSAFGEMIETWGIPEHCLFDNGREFANKWLTGGAPTRFRFKVRDQDPLGVLPMMGVKIHWATPGHGQAKPIERAFRDLADRIALDPRFAGAYVGNRPDAKPEDYGSRAIPRDEFLRVLDEGIRVHNARQGRLTETAKGRSFDETFAESYAQSRIRKATPEQNRLWLMGQKVCKLHRGHGSLTLFKNGYWADWMNEYAGQEVVARFDPENLHAGIHVYTLAGAYLGQAGCREKVGFFDLVGARLQAKAERQRRRAEKDILDAMRPVSVRDYAAELDKVPEAETPLVAAKVVDLDAARIRQPLFSREMPVPAADPVAEERHETFVLEFRRSETASPEPAETDSDRFRRALAIEERSEAGQPIGAAEAEWLRTYQMTPEYTRQRMLFEDFGEAGLG